MNQPFDHSGKKYLSIFENTLGINLDKALVGKIDFSRNQVLIEDLALTLFEYHDNVIYPVPDDNIIQPYFQGQYIPPSPSGFQVSNRGTYKAGQVDDFQALLLFAHKVIFEDTFFHIVHDLRTVYQHRKAFHGSERNSPPIHQDVYTNLSQHLIALCDLKPLIEKDILIPHFLSTRRVPNFVESQLSNRRYIDENGWSLMQDALANLFEHHQYNPNSSLVKLSKTLSDIFAKYDDVEDFLIDSDDYDEIWDIKDVLYRLIIEKNYSLYNGDILDPIFKNSDEEYLYSFFLNDVFNYDNPRNKIHPDLIKLSYLNGFTRLINNRIPHTEIINIRTNESHFEAWRGIVSTALTNSILLENRNSVERGFKNEINEEFKRWKDIHPSIVGKGVLKSITEIAEGVGVGFISDYMLDETFSIKSEFLGGGIAVFKGLLNQVQLIKKNKRIRKHFLYVTDSVDLS